MVPVSGIYPSLVIGERAFGYLKRKY
ncbi:hypothetical protein SBA4_1920007 [Candidatus Sulfopaludibacter sp. SbA4]|nr:hypothetical protein SBA4_1920007 [Candidatus Sulfopaludibacter sp. SbA4]